MFSSDRRDLFPLPSSVDKLEGISRSLPGKLPELTEYTTLALNAMWDDTGGYTDRIMSGGTMERVESTRAGHAETRQYIRRRCEDSLRAGVFHEPSSKGGLETVAEGVYSLANRKAEPLDPKRISLPPVGIAASVSMTEVLPKHLGDKYRKEHTMCTPSQEELDKIKPKVMIDPKRYPELIQLLLERGVIGVQKQKPKVINGMFAVEKDETKQRLIFDGRRANLYFEIPAKPELPHPGILTQLTKEESEDLYVGKTDLDNFYHRILLPTWVQQYFGLPKVKLGKNWVYPYMKSVPMGWSHSVFIAQEIHSHVVRLAGLPADKDICSGQATEIGVGRYGKYIDDFFVLGSDKSLLEEWLSSVMKKFAECGFPTKATKTVMPTRDPVTVLGITFRKNGLLSPNWKKLQLVVWNTHLFLKKKTWTKKALQCLLGSWNWFLLIQRPIMANITRLYELREKEGVITPSFKARAELAKLCVLAPLIAFEIRKRPVSATIATDASLRGGGAVYTTPQECTVEEVKLFNKPIPSGYQVNTATTTWKTAIKHKWENQEHINILEGRAVLLMLRWISRTQKHWAKSLHWLIDSQVWFYILKKGRTSAWKLRAIARRISAITMALDLRIFYWWIASEENPADEPSRSV